MTYQMHKWAVVALFAVISSFLLLGIPLATGAQENNAGEADTSEVTVLENSAEEDVDESAQAEVMEVKADDSENEDETTFSKAGLFFRAGNIVRFRSPLSQDVFAAGYRVEVDDTIEGDLFAGAQDVIVDGTVTGSVRAAGNTVIINGVVEGNVLAVGSSVTIAEGAEVRGHVNVYAASVIIDGSVERDVHAAGAFVSIDGTVNGAIDVEAEEVTFDDNAQLAGSVAVAGPNEPEVSTTAQGVDSIQYTYKSYEKKVQYELNGGVFAALFFTGVVAWLLLIASMIIVGVLILWIWPTATHHVISTMDKNSSDMWLRGVLVFIVVPIVALFLLVTIIGIPLSFLTMVIYGLGLAIAPLYAGMYLGEKLFKTSTRKGNERYWHFIVGYVLFSLIIAIPFVGQLVQAIAMVWVLGAMVLVFNPRKKQHDTHA